MPAGPRNPLGYRNPLFLLPNTLRGSKSKSIVYPLCLCTSATCSICHRISVPASGPRIRAMDLTTQVTYAYVMYMPCPGPLHRTCTGPASA
ncbi:hypothetical protein N658DRAFT_94662 [Parathielavia hyrcaniae]|uniref:Uncharacterized protein n=1 Tax=Parathielavia hyrcaniae TaxID=113614 RepID=A0AAN6Q2X2_9PEZI|nr:hypothetical protein N658DRAFT_94662 [Parathielavia hyrcaniae]